MLPPTPPSSPAPSIDPTAHTSLPSTTPSAHLLLRTLSRLHRSSFALVLLLFLNRAFFLAKDNAELLILLDQTQQERRMLRFQPPSLTLLRTVTYPYRRLLEPLLVGESNLPLAAIRARKPVLFVSNHPILGLDFPLLLTELYARHGVFLRALADHSHFQIPGNATVMRDVVGAVDGTPRNVNLLLSNGWPVLVYPGGARETFKKRGEPAYALKWGDRVGFVRAAMKAGAIIVPCASVGTEDMVDVIADLPINWLPVPFLWGGDRTIPAVGPTSLQRVYFGFAPPIYTDGTASSGGGSGSGSGGGSGDGRSAPETEAQLHSRATVLRDQVQAAVLQQIAVLKKVQEADPNRFAGDRLRHTFARLFATSGKSSL